MRNTKTILVGQICALSLAWPVPHLENKWAQLLPVQEGVVPLFGSQISSSHPGLLLQILLSIT